jgi:hypothetical protein
VHCFPVFNNPFEKETQAGERVTLFGLLMTSDLALFHKIIPSIEPKKKSVKNSYWKKDSASHQKSPKSMCKASEDVG